MEAQDGIEIAMVSTSLQESEASGMTSAFDSALPPDGILTLDPDNVKSWSQTIDEHPNRSYAI